MTTPWATSGLEKVKPLWDRGLEGRVGYTAQTR
jgi:hypothetical protein